MSKEVIKLDESIIEVFENSDGMLLIKGGTNVGDISPTSTNVICFNRNCPSCVPPVDVDIQPL